MIIMTDLFANRDVVEILRNRFVVIIGDSIQRGIYKDLVLILQGNRHLTQGDLKAKGELSFEGDTLIEGGRLGRLNNGIGYREVRQYLEDFHLLRFYFITRCFSKYMESILEDLKKEPQPDVVIMNSCLWDITRYGRTAIVEYKENMRVLFAKLKEILPKETLVIWNTTLPISKNARGGFLVPEIEFRNSTLRLDVLEANFYARGEAVKVGFDVIDLNYHFRLQLHRRVEDGIHWDMDAHRRMTNIILSHICDAWGLPLPKNAVRVVREKEMKTPQRSCAYRGAEMVQLSEKPSLGTALHSQRGGRVPVRARLGCVWEGDGGGSLHGRRNEAPEWSHFDWQEYAEDDAFYRKERAWKPKYRSRPYSNRISDRR